MAFAPLGPYFATCGYDRTMRVWRTDQLQPIRLLTGHLSDVRCCAFHPNVCYVASGSDDASVRVWSIKSAETVRLLCANGHSAAVCSVAFTPDGLTLASGGEDHCVLIWHLPTGTLRSRLVGHRRPVWALAFSCEGAQLASSAADCTIAVWDGAHAAASAAPPASRDGGDRQQETHLLVRLHTKHTPALAVRYSRTNLLLGSGGFQPPPQSPQPPAPASA